MILSAVYYLLYVREAKNKSREKEKHNYINENKNTELTRRRTRSYGKKISNNSAQNNKKTGLVD